MPLLPAAALGDDLPVGGDVPAVIYLIGIVRNVVDVAGGEGDVAAVLEIAGPVGAVVDLGTADLAAAAVIAGDAQNAAAIEGAVCHLEIAAVHETQHAARAAVVLHVLGVPGGEV